MRGLLPCCALPHRASDKCQREKRKTVNGDDLIWAMTTLGFDEYIEVRAGTLLRLGCGWEDVALALARQQFASRAA